ncbi:hypothetical protein CDS [Bradyrhizobium sp.]|nr:hypothetical protein CDS [Bradyrhizobium sp.]
MLMMWFSVGVLHRVHPVHNKVQNDLLKLNMVAKDRKRIPRDHVRHFEVPANSQRGKKSDRLFHN